MRQSERIGLLIALGSLGIAAISLTSRTAHAATQPGGDPYAPQGTPTTPATPGTQVTYGTFAGPVRGDPTIWRAQRMLEALGYDPRGDDGRWGPDSRNALNDFQSAYGQPRTSTLTAAALDRLEAEYARIAPPGAVGDLAGARALPAGCYHSRY